MKLGERGIEEIIQINLLTDERAALQRSAAAVQASRRCIFVGVHTKFGVTSFCRFAQVADFEVIVTETALPHRDAKRYAGLGPRVIRT